mmetsp:Transcript_163806/g.525350  ORF Transcript_163806/g.525350 Transcript_163806/m.525350 type:complete len:255 (-) Transcript_163806:1139-1903(-)
MLSFLQVKVANPQTKLDMFCGEKSANSSLARTTARNHSTSRNFIVAHAQVTMDTSSGHIRLMSSIALPMRARNINVSCSCIRAQAQSVFDTCWGSKSRILRWVWTLTISTHGPPSRYIIDPRPWSEFAIWRLPKNGSRSLKRSKRNLNRGSARASGGRPTFPRRWNAVEITIAPSNSRTQERIASLLSASTMRSWSSFWRFRTGSSDQGSSSSPCPSPSAPPAPPPPPAPLAACICMTASVGNMAYSMKLKLRP